MTVAILQLREPGPAQSSVVYHFCGRPPGTAISAQLEPVIAEMTPEQRLSNILWEGGLRGSVPFGATNPMVCFSETPLDHLIWLLHDRAFPPWALLVTREWVYHAGGGPVWYARDAQHRTLTPQQRDWAVRFDAYTNDWLHEREWRVPTHPGFPWLALTFELIVIIGEPTWQPWRLVPEPTGRYIGAVPEMAPQWRLPPLWNQIQAYWWDSTNRRFSLVHTPRQG